MSKVVVRDGETLDEALRRFKRQVNKAGTIQECRKRECTLEKNIDNLAINEFVLKGAEKHLFFIFFAINSFVLLKGDFYALFY